MASQPTHSGSDFEAAAAGIVGLIVFEMSLIETNIGLLIRSAVEATSPKSVDPLIDRLTLKAKLDALKELVESRQPNDADVLANFRKWHVRADKLRAKRNTLVHGRWHMKSNPLEIVNIAPGMSSTDAQQTRYSLDALREELLEAEAVSKTLSRLGHTWL
jgi:hypothetical protein